MLVAGIRNRQLRLVRPGSTRTEGNGIEPNEVQQYWVDGRFRQGQRQAAGLRETASQSKLGRINPQSLRVETTPSAYPSC